MSDDTFIFPSPSSYAAIGALGLHPKTNNEIKHIKYMRTEMLVDDQKIAAYDNNNLLTFVVKTGAPGENDIAFLDDPNRYCKRVSSNE